MAKAVRYNEMDDLEKLLRGEVISNSSNESPGIERLDETVVSPEAIQQYGSKLSPNAEFSRRNFNDLESSNFDQLRNLNQSMEEAKARKDDSLDTEGHLLAMLARRAQAESPKTNGKSAYDAASFQKGLKGQLDELSKAPSDVSETDKIIAAFGPAVLASAFGSNGAPAGVEAFKVGQNELENRRKQMLEERKAKILGIGKQIEGTGALLKSETEKRKQDFDEAKYGTEREDKNVNVLAQYAKYRADRNLKDSEATQKAFLDQFNKGQAITEKGISNTSALEDKQTQRDFTEKQNELNRISAEKRAKMMAQSQAQARAEKPPTEGMTASANAYASMSKADQAFDRMKNAYGGKIPSMNSKFYDVQKSVFETADGNTLVGTLFKQIPDEPTRRQIQAELDFLAPLLRKESGAAISAGEYISYGNRFFPRMGDSPAIIAEKEASRKQSKENFKIGAGKAPIPQIIQPEAVPEIKVINGIQYKKAQGGWEKVK